MLVSTNSCFVVATTETTIFPSEESVFVSVVPLSVYITFEFGVPEISKTATADGHIRGVTALTFASGFKITLMVCMASARFPKLSTATQRILFSPKGNTCCFNVRIPVMVCPFRVNVWGIVVPFIETTYRCTLLLLSEAKPAIGVAVNVEKVSC